MPSDEQAIRTFHSTWIDAVNAGDLDRLLAMMTADAVFLIVGEESVGRDAFSTKFAGAHQQLRIRCVSDLVDVVIADEVAYTLSRDSLTVSPLAGGDERRLAGDRLTVYRKQPDGRWLLDRDANVLAPVLG